MFEKTKIKKEAGVGPFLKYSTASDWCYRCYCIVSRQSYYLLYMATITTHVIKATNCLTDRVRKDGLLFFVTFQQRQKNLTQNAEIKKSLLLLRTNERTTFSNLIVVIISCVLAIKVAADDDWTQKIVFFSMMTTSINFNRVKNITKPFDKVHGWQMPLRALKGFHLALHKCHVKSCWNFIISFR